MERGAPPGRRGARDADDSQAVVACLRFLFQSAREYSKALQRKVRLSGPQVWALTLIGEHPELSLRELAAHMYAHPSTVSGIVQRLVARGAVRRRCDHADRRGVRLALTGLGRRLVRNSPPPVPAALREVLTGLAPGRLRQLRQSLELIVRRLRPVTARSRPPAGVREADPQNANAQGA